MATPGGLYSFWSPIHTWVVPRETNDFKLTDGRGYFRPVVFDSCLIADSITPCYPYGNNSPLANTKADQSQTQRQHYKLLDTCSETTITTKPRIPNGSK